MIHSRQTSNSVHHASKKRRSIQYDPVQEVEQTVSATGNTTCPDGSHGDVFTAGAALHRISGGIQGGESPLQFSDAINSAHQQFGNRATVQFAAQQMRLHDRDSAAVHAIAKSGFRGPHEGYPYREQIQRAFGHHDIGNLRAHTDATARAANAAFGSSAYHKGGDVAFASAPTLAAAAHEAAHYVQNAGATRLGGGVGEAGDAYEQHADRVAERVVAGEPVADLLDRGPGGAVRGTPSRHNGPVQMMLPRPGALRGLMSIVRGGHASGGNVVPPRVPGVTRQEAMARRREVPIPEMNELYARLNSSHFSYAENRKRVIESGLLRGITDVSTGEDVARRFKTFVLAGDPEFMEGFDRVMAQGFTSGGVEPLTTALMDPEISSGLNKQPLSGESFLEFVSDARKYVQGDDSSIGILVNRSGTSDGWEVAGVLTQYLEGFIAKDPEDQVEFSKLNDDDRTRWIEEGRAIPRAMDFGEKVMGKYPWTEHLGGTLDMFDTKELLYGPDPITHQDNLMYAFMAGVEPRYQGVGLGSLLFQALEAQNYAKGIDATMAEFTSISRALGRTFGWKKHKEVLYKDYLVWRYLTADGKYDIPAEGGRYSREEMARKGLAGEHRYAPWAGIDWEGPPHNQKTGETQYKPDPRYSSGWPSGPGGLGHAIPTVIRGGVSAYKTFPLPQPTPYDERILTPGARKKSKFSN